MLSFPALKDGACRINRVMDKVIHPERIEGDTETWVGMLKRDPLVVLDSIKEALEDYEAMK